MGCKWTRHVVVGWGVSGLDMWGVVGCSWVRCKWTRHVVVVWGVSGLDIL